MDGDRGGTPTLDYLWHYENQRCGLTHARPSDPHADVYRRLSDFILCGDLVDGKAV